MGVSSCDTCDAPCGGNPAPIPPLDRRVHAVKEGHVGRAFVRRMGASAESPHVGHEHNEGHLTYIKTGPLRIDWRNSQTEEHGSEVVEDDDCFVWIEADIEHTFVALAERAVWRCIFFRPTDPGDKPRGIFHQERPGG